MTKLPLVGDISRKRSANSEPAGIDDWQLKDDADLVREDLTALPFVTIDGESTKDMDDALYAQQLPNGDFALTIAIADPTAYITQKMRWTKLLASVALPFICRVATFPCCTRSG